MYDLSTVVQFLISGIGVGCIYGLVGIGFSVIYNSSSIVNFAQGAFVMLGGIVTYVLYSRVGLPLVLAAAGAIVGVTALGVVIELVLIRPLRAREATVFSMILATLACQILIENAVLHFVGDRPYSLPSFTPGTPLKVLGAAVGLQIMWIVGVSLVLVHALGQLYRRTLVGKAMRACAVNPEVARILGIKVGRMTAYAFGLSAALGAIGGILITPTQYTAFYIGVPFAISGFIAAIIGGFGNPLGAFVGGIALGVLQSLGVVVLEAGYKNVVAFTLLLLLLLFRPHGLFGSLVEEE